MEFRSETKCQPDHSGDSIQTKDWIIHAGARQMQITGLHGQSDIFLNEPVSPHTPAGRRIALSSYVAGKDQPETTEITEVGTRPLGWAGCGPESVVC